MDKQPQTLELENTLYEVVAQLELLADGLHNNRDVESYPISLALRNIIDNCPPVDYMSYLYNLKSLGKEV